MYCTVGQLGFILLPRLETTVVQLDLTSSNTTSQTLHTQTRRLSALSAALTGRKSATFPHLILYTDFCILMHNAVVVGGCRNILVMLAAVAKRSSGCPVWALTLGQTVEVAVQSWGAAFQAAPDSTAKLTRLS